MDRHIYPSAGACCFTTSAIALILLKTKVYSLLVFLNEIVVKYFENNSYYEINGRYFDEEYAHGSLGIQVAYCDILDVKSTSILSYLLVERLEGRLISENDLCYCNSNIQLGKCKNGKHLNNYRSFLLIDQRVLFNDLKHFKNILTQ